MVPINYLSTSQLMVKTGISCLCYALFSSVSVSVVKIHHLSLETNAKLEVSYHAGSSVCRAPQGINQVQEGRFLFWVESKSNTYLKDRTTLDVLP